MRLETGWPSLPVAWLGRPIVEADVLIDFSHIKGHGACGFGSACKNLAMGCTPGETRGAMHGLETLYCDCWGFTTPALVPDIGITASRDIAAIEHACLDLIKTEEVIPGSITPPYALREGKHLFEKLHGKDPYVQVKWLETLKAIKRV